MSNRLETRHEVTGVATRWAIGFVGSLTILFVLPRLVRAVVRNYAFRLVAETIAIISFGLLAEKAMEWAAEWEREPSESAPPPS